MEELVVGLKEQARKLGFGLVGIVPASPARRLDAYLHWITQQYHGEMAYLARPDRLARRQDLEQILPGVQTIICVGLDYGTVQMPAHLAQDPSRGRVSNYAWAADYHQLMTPRLQRLADWLAYQTRQMVRSRVYVDTGAILERDHAEKAGLGFIGKNSMLIAPQSGSWFFLGEILTTIEMPADSPKKPMPSCGHCHRCLDACPTAAFPQPYVLDARRCISYLTIELKGWIPTELRPLMGNWVYGCDICQIVCPFNRFAPETVESAFYPTSWELAAPSLLTLLTLDEQGFQTRFANSPIRRIKRERLVRNACIATGNWKSEAGVPALLPLLQEPSPIIRGHTAWALGKIGSPIAQNALYHALQQETDAQVQAELLSALAPT